MGLYKFLEKVFDWIYVFSCEDINLEKNIAKMEIFKAFFGTGFLTKSLVEKSRNIDGKGHSLPRKIRVFLDIFCLCIFDKESMSLLKEITYKSVEKSEDEQEKRHFNTENFLSLMLYCIYDTSDRVMKVVEVNDKKKNFREKGLNLSIRWYY